MLRCHSTYACHLARSWAQLCKPRRSCQSSWTRRSCIKELQVSWEVVTRDRDYGHVGSPNEGHSVCMCTQRTHVWYIYLHLVDFYGKCRYIYHTWILWGMRMYHVWIMSKMYSGRIVVSRMHFKDYSLTNQFKHGRYKVVGFDITMDCRPLRSHV